MKRFKRNGLSKIIVGLFFAAAVSFTLTGVAQSAVTGAPEFLSQAEDVLKKTGSISAMLTIPYSQYSDKEDTYTEDEEKQEIVTSDTSVAESESVTIPPSSESEKENTSEQTKAEASQMVPQTSSPDENSDFVDIDETVKPITNLITYNIRNDFDDLEGYTQNSGTIEKYTFTAQTGPAIIDLANGQLNNCTQLDNSVVSEICGELPDMKIELDGEPQVLIMHTHTTESYAIGNGLTYDSEYTGRSLCPANSVVGVGAIIAQKLADNGICTIHDGLVFDDPIYSNSYSRSYERVKQLLELYPSIKVVLDIHRDGIENDNVRIAPVAEINGKNAAQIMIICGCDDGSGMLPDYAENLRFASLLQSTLEEKYSGLTRPMLFDYRYYNQDLTTGSLLIEVGALGNTVKEAQYSAELIGNGISDMLIELSK